MAWGKPLSLLHWQERLRKQEETCWRRAADPDANLGLALGFPEDTVDSDRCLFLNAKNDCRNATEDGQELHTSYVLNPKVKDIPETNMEKKLYHGVRLLLLGTVDTAGGGCVCPGARRFSSLWIISNLVLQRDDVVILDMEAGLEHLGRGSNIWNGSVYCSD